MKMILTYVYYNWRENETTGTIDMQDMRCMEEAGKLWKAGYSENVTYWGKMNCTCGGTEPFGEHYGMIIQADKETTKAILAMIDADILESFDLETMEKLDKNLEGIDEWFWTIQNQEARLEKSGFKYLEASLSKAINDAILDRA